MKRAQKEIKNEVNNKAKLISILRIIFIIIALISIIVIIVWNINGIQNKKITDKVSNMVSVKEVASNERKEKEYSVDFESINKINKDAVAWIKIPGTEIEYVIVKASDNSYYLNRNFEKKYNNAGWIFADYKNKFDGTDKNIVIYGHNREDGTMFGTLKDALKEEWYNNEENYEIDLIIENGEKHKYQVFSVYQIKTEDYYIDTEFKSGEFQKFVTTLKNRSKKDFGVEVSEEDSILTLSTCANNYRDRIVLHAKEIKY